MSTPSSLIAVIRHTLYNTSSPNGIFSCEMQCWDATCGVPYDSYAVQGYAGVSLRATHGTSVRPEAGDVQIGVKPPFSLVMIDEADRIAKQLRKVVGQLRRWDAKFGEAATFGTEVMRLMRACGVQEAARQTPSGIWELTSNLETVAHWVNETIRRHARNAA